MSSLITSQKTQLRAESSTLSLQAAWIGFDPDLYDGGGSSSADPTLVESSLW